MFSTNYSHFPKSQGSQDAYPSDCIGDFSQLQNAQCTQLELYSENSQENSQLIFSQNDDFSGPMPDSYRQVPVYEKYISRPSLFSGRGKGKNAIQGKTNRNPLSSMANNMKGPTLPGQQTYVQHMISQKAKAKERDERDLLGSIVKMVKDCVNEVKSTLSTFKEADNSKYEDLQGGLKMLTSSFDQNNSKILKAIEDRETLLGRMHSLERDLFKKDEEIKLLQEQTNHNNHEDKCADLWDKMKTFVSDQQNQMEEKIKHIVETIQEQFMVVKDLNQSNKVGFEESSKSFQDLKFSNQRQLHEVEKRLIDEMVHVRDDFDRQRRDMESFYRNQLQTFHQKQNRDIELYLKQGIEHALQKSEFITARDIKDHEAEILGKNQLQQRQIENQIKNSTKQQSDFLIQQCQESLKKHQNYMKKSLQDNFDSLRNEQSEFFDQSNKKLTEFCDVNKMAWENDCVPKHIQEQLNVLHSSHQSEIKRLEAEIKTQKNQASVSQENTSKKNSCDENQTTGNVYDSCTDRKSSRGAGSIFEKNVGFVSPKPLQGTRWNSRQIFGRLNPSPVATVLPQRKSGTGNALSDTQVNIVVQRPVQSSIRKFPPVQNEFPKHNALTQANQNLSKAVHNEAETFVPSTTRKLPRKRKQLSYRKRGTKRRKQSKTLTNDERCDAVTKCHPSPRKSADIPVEGYGTNYYTKASRKLSVDDFCDGDTAHQGRPALTQNGMDLELTDQSYSSKKIPSDGSAQSSPSLSVAEVFVSRRVQHPITTIRGKDMFELFGQGSSGSDGGEFFSSPNMLEKLKERPRSPDLLQSLDQVQLPRIKERRKLCDFDTHSQVFQMIQCLQKSKY